MSPRGLIFAIFAAGSLGVLGLALLVYDFFFRRSARIDERFRSRFRDEARERAKNSPLFHDLANLSADTAGEQLKLSVRLQIYLAQGAIEIPVSYLATLAGVLAAAAAATAWFLVGGWIAPLPAALAGFAVIPFYAFWQRRKRMQQLCRQLPEAFDVMSRALRAGQTVPAAFQAVSQDFPKPISEEFALCFEQQHLGIPFETSLRDLARRTGFAETQLFATALIINRQVGGNLAEVLAKLAVTMRRRNHFQARVKALTGEGRMQAVVLTALPVASFVALLVFHRDYAQALLDRPWLLGVTVGAQLLGAACIHRIVNFKF